MSGLSTKPYLVRAIFEWCADSGLTPYLSVQVDAQTRVPLEHVKNGEIVLNVSLSATRNLTIGNDLIQFSARFNGVSREISVPMTSVLGIFARENGQGMFFQAEPVLAQDSAADPGDGTSAGVKEAPPKLVPASGSQDRPPVKPGPDRTRLKLIK